MDNLSCNDTPDPDMSLIILESLICMMRSNGLLTRAHIQELSDLVQQRAARDNPSGTCPAAHVAAREIMRIERHVSQRYGGKHRRACN